MFPWFYGQSNGLLKRKALEDDVRKIYNFYVDNGYLDVEVNTPSLIIKENDVEVGFNIKEGKPYFMKEYEITPKDFNLNDFDKETKEIGLLTKITKEERFSLTKTKNIVEEIQKLFKDRGYYNTSITVTPQKNAQSVVVVLEITLKNKYQIKNVLITGNTKTLDRVVRRNVLLQPGMTYSETLLADSILKMKRTGIIGNPKIKAINVEDNNLDLLVEVNELKTGAFLMGGGYGTETGFNINGVVTEKNLFGSGLNVGLNANLSKISKSYSFSFLNPALFDSDFSFGTAITKSNLQTGIDLTKVKQDNQNIKMMFGYNVNKYLSMNLNTIMEQVDTTYLFFNNQIKYTKNSIGYGVTFDNTVGIPFPRKGSFIDNTIEYSGFGGDVVTVRDFFTTKYFYDTSDLLGIDSILRYKFSIGSIKYYAGSTLLDGYALGGIGSVRGYEDYAVGIVGFGEEGYNRTMLNSVELSFDLFGIPNLRTGIFYDNGTLGKNKFFDLTKQSFGVNLEWYSPIGPVQFVVANPINTNKTDRTSKVGFSIGRQF
jgi:outer membrane protein insertion porin family